MIPAQFDYVTPRTLDEAVRLLAERPDDAKVLAGGHSLLPAMKLRLAQPSLLVDIGRIRDLSYVTAENGHIRIGAMTTHYEIESSPLLAERCPLLPETATHIGDVQVRNFINSSRAARGLTTSKVGSPDRTDGGTDTVAVK